MNEPQPLTLFRVTMRGHKVRVGSFADKRTLESAIREDLKFTEAAGQAAARYEVWKARWELLTDHATRDRLWEA